MSVIYSSTFSGTNGSLPAGWNNVNGTTDVQGNKFRMLTAASAYAPAGAYYNGLVIPQDNVTYIDILLTTVTGTDFYVSVCIRATNATFNANSRQDLSWQWQYYAAAGPALYGVDAAGTQTFLAGMSDPGCVQGDTLHLKFAPLGQTFQVKSWKNAAAEPGAYDSFLDTAAPVGTMMSIFTINGGDVSAQQHDVTLVSIDDLQSNISLIELGRYTPGSIQTRNMRGW